MYSLILDDRGQVTRSDARTALDGALLRPLDPMRAKEYDRETWGMTPEAIVAAAEKDSIWGSLTYGAAG